MEVAVHSLTAVNVAGKKIIVSRAMAFTLFPSAIAVEASFRER